MSGVCIEWFLGGPMYVSQTTSTQIKTCKKGRKLKSSGPSNFCCICTCSFTIWQGNFARHLVYLWKMYLLSLNVKVLHKESWWTMGVTQLCSGESLFYNMILNVASKDYSAAPKTSLYFASPLAEAHRPMLTKRWEKSQAPLLSLLFDLPWCLIEWQTSENNDVHICICNFFAVA